MQRIRGVSQHKQPENSQVLLEKDETIRELQQQIETINLVHDEELRALENKLAQVNEANEIEQKRFRNVEIQLDEELVEIDQLNDKLKIITDSRNQLAQQHEQTLLENFNMKKTLQNYADTIQELINENAKLHEKMRDPYNMALFAAVQKNEAAKVADLEQLGADIDAKNENGLTPLFVAYEQKHEEVFKRLLHIGARLDIKNPQGQTILQQTLADDNAQFTKAIIDNMAREELNKDALSFLFNQAQGPQCKKLFADQLFLLAAKQGDMLAIHDMYANGANINAQDNAGETALHKASYYKNKELVEFLLSKNAATDIKDKFDQVAAQATSDSVIQGLFKKHHEKLAAAATKIQTSVRGFFARNEAKAIKQFNHDVSERSKDVIDKLMEQKDFTHVGELANLIAAKKFEVANGYMDELASKQEHVAKLG